MSLGSQALIASNITMTSSIENVIAVSSGTLAAYRFNGKNFNLWRMKMHAHLESLELTDVIEHPLAATEEEIRALLSVRASDGEEALTSLLAPALGGATRVTATGRRPSGSFVI